MSVLQEETGMSLTVEEILSELGLQDPKGYADAILAIRAAELAGEEKVEGDDPLHGTGRTTAMLVNAVFRSQFGLVAIRGSTPTNSRILTHRARRMAIKVGIDGENLRSGHGVLGRRPSDLEWFADHNVDAKSVPHIPWLDKVRNL
jgi:hypothetical protein